MIDRKHSMRERSLKLMSKLAICGVVLMLLGSLHSSVLAQANTALQRPISADGEKSGSDDNNRPFAGVEEEMRAKRAIHEADREYQENLTRARDLSAMGSAIVSSFKENNMLSAQDVKKLEKVEKLAKGIRRAAGGSEDEVEIEKLPRDLASAISMLDDLSKSLKEKVEKTPKHVISAAVIDEANVLLELIRILRRLST